MRKDIEKRVTEEAKFIVGTKSTVRETAAFFGMSKSTVWRDMILYLKELDLELFKKVDKVLQKNKAEKHLRGGQASKLKLARRNFL